MAQLTFNEIKHLARLANLDLTPAESEKFGHQLSKIIEYVSELNKIDTRKVAPTSQTTGLENIFRADEVQGVQSLNQNGYFSVPAIIDKKTK